MMFLALIAPQNAKNAAVLQTAVVDWEINTICPMTQESRN